MPPLCGLASVAATPFSVGLGQIVAPVRGVLSWLDGKEGRAMTDHLAPGMLVRNPDAPDWGLGQIQSVIGHRVTVNFEHRGKELIDITHARLEVVAAERD
jgi:hypothetical protein